MDGLVIRAALTCPECIEAEQVAKATEACVVQLDPDLTENLAFAGCFMVITERRSDFVQGYVQGLGTREERGGIAYYRAKHGTYQIIGPAKWVLGEDNAD